MDIDQLARAMKDHEKRLNRIEAWMEAQGRHLTTLVMGEDGVPRPLYPLGEPYTAATAIKPHNVKVGIGGWCECGRDVCRAPDCPSHKPDPMGR